MVRERPQKCERARAWISAELDGELSEFESVLLLSHLGQCVSCSTFRADTSTFSAALRDAPPEPMSRPVSVSRRRRIAFQPLRVPAVAALAISMIAVGGLFESLHTGALFPQSTRSSVAAFDDQDLHQLQLVKGQAALAQLRIRRAEVQPALSRHTGFQNP
jgi:predicted anti-sigma-YlaC factor YlaD